MELKETRIYKDLQVIAEGTKNCVEYENLHCRIEYVLSVACCENYLKDVYKNEVIKCRKVVGKHRGKNVFAIGKAQKISGKFNNWYLDVE